jgi:hypothetical protein
MRFERFDSLPLSVEKIGVIPDGRRKDLAHGRRRSPHGSRGCLGAPCDHHSRRKGNGRAKEQGARKAQHVPAAHSVLASLILAAYRIASLGAIARNRYHL